MSSLPYVLIKNSILKFKFSELNIYKVISFMHLYSENVFNIDDDFLL